MSNQSLNAQATITSLPVYTYLCVVHFSLAFNLLRDRRSCYHILMSPAMLARRQFSSQLWLLSLVFSLSFLIFLSVLFNKSLITPLGSEVEFPGYLGPHCFWNVLHAVNLTSLPFTHVPMLYHLARNLSQLSIASECAVRLAPLFNTPALRSDPALSCFLRRKFFLKAEKRRRLQNILKNLCAAFRTANIDLVLDSGTLIGSLRHHGRIPYDDDFDFRINYFQKEEAWKILLAFTAKFKDCKLKDTESINGHWKLAIMCDEPQLETCRFEIDFLFWRKMIYSLQFTEYPFNYLSTTIFPLAKRPFEGVLFDSPRDPLRVYRATYDNPSLMECYSFDHNPLRREICAGRMDCARLEPFVPYVRKITDDRYGSLEILINSGHVQDIFFQPKIDDTVYTFL